MESDISYNGPVKRRRGFSVYVDLFNKGDFNEIKVIPEQEEYKILLDDIKLATISQNSQNKWIKVDGNMPREKLEQVGNMISLRINSIKD